MAVSASEAIFHPSFKKDVLKLCRLQPGLSTPKLMGLSSPKLIGLPSPKLMGLSSPKLIVLSSPKLRRAGDMSAKKVLSSPYLYLWGYPAQGFPAHCLT